ncbi:MAG: Cys-tRNA(Pro) deacylase [Burkholderiales bacterium]|jgi:Cys-tRNA(Pro) deacylase|nr:Cys-tRNA(Pro) deacylase [Burkholderiales bacterium]
MARDKAPVTPAVRALRAAGIAFTDHVYDYEPRGGTEVSARELGVDEHTVVKTLVMQDDRQQPLIVLMHGDRKVSTQRLARHLGVRDIAPCDPEVAQRHTGYLVGGTSPLGTRRSMPVYVERSILALSRIYLNGGKRGYLVGVEPGAVARILKAVPVDVAVDGD